MSAVGAFTVPVWASETGTVLEATVPVLAPETGTVLGVTVPVLVHKTGTIMMVELGGLKNMDFVVEVLFFAGNRKNMSNITNVEFLFVSNT